MTSSNDLVENYDQQVSMGSSKDRNVHWNGGCVWLVESDSEIPFSTQQKQDEYTDMNETNSTLVSSGVIQMVQNWSQNIQDFTGLEDKEQETFVVFAELPEENQQLLVKLNLLLGVR